MTELVADVLPWLAAFYVLDAVVQLRRGQWVFTRSLTGGVSVLRSGIHTAALAPTDLAVFAHDLPFLPARDGICVFEPDARAPIPVVRPESLALVTWAELSGLRVERTTVKSHARVIFRARSPYAARLVLGQLRALREAGSELREAKATAMLKDAFELSSARARWSAMKKPLAATRAFAFAEAVLLFAGLPFVAFLSTDELRWERVGLALLVAHLGTVLSAAWTMKRSGLGGAVGSTAVLTLAIFPAYAARATGQVARDAFLAWDPSVIAEVLLPREAWMRFARQECVRLEESVTATPGLGLEGYWAARRQALDGMLRAAGTTRAEVLASPQFTDDVAAWCPLCLGEYREVRERCADCGVALEVRGEAIGRLNTEAPREPAGATGS